ncbi:uncharacterized protein ALTATR162_LOCUS245 [Alternaria atra]|uniref:Uncharacterized protein n=1 Tax=Alternaria atra TaxID=119953 RepID=A0A8J2HR39_9PLEO|nr:uncharacterized protein ALTATR162_LOCUS245 [Alternaria atra]CAG5137909.1 unnamed protein product [Alternaria atra]
MGISHHFLAHLTNAYGSKVVWTAFREHLDATEIGKTMRKAFGQPEPPSLVKKLPTMLYDFFRSVNPEPDPESQRHTWTHTHSLYATIGGFVVDTRDLGQDYLPEGRQRMTLALGGLAFIAGHDPYLIPNLSVSEITDKSKANMFTKMITCGQALWFGIQYLTRISQGLSISLLEINTAVHAACALALYFFFWWDKPLDVGEPTICTHDDIHPMAVFGTVSQMYLVDWSSIDMDDWDDHENLYSSSESEIAVSHPTVEHILLRPSKDSKFPSTDYLVYHGFVMNKNEDLSHLKARFNDLTKLDFDRFKLAAKADRKYGLRTVKSSRFLPVDQRTPKVFSDIF